MIIVPSILLTKSQVTYTSGSKRDPALPLTRIGLRVQGTLIVSLYIDNSFSLYRLKTFNIHLSFPAENEKFDT